MRVRDVRGDRWRASMRFLRTLGESLHWEDDRVALALFAHIATPQIRLTRDPNTFSSSSITSKTSRRSASKTIRRGTPTSSAASTGACGSIDRDEEMRAAQRGVGSRREPAASRARRPASSNNPQAFVLISDGQAWSGAVAKSLALAQERGIPLFVVGVGTTAGGLIPDPKRDPGSPVASRSIDRRWP